MGGAISSGIGSLGGAGSSMMSPFASLAGGSLGSPIGQFSNDFLNNLNIQSNFNATPFQAPQQNFMPGIQEAQGNFRQNYANEGALAQALLAQNAGAGPNPALSQLRQTTNQNIQQGTGMIASQKGINPALAARLAAQQTATANQNAAGEAATMRAQQILANQSQLGQLYGNMGNQQLGMHGTLQSGLATQNQLASDNYNKAQALNAQTAIENAKARAGVVSGLMGGGAAALAAAAEGGRVPGKAKVEGDSYDNDTVPTMLSPGEIVVPRSKAKNPELAKQFIDHLMKKEGGNRGDGGSEPSFKDVLMSHQKLTKKMQELEKRIGRSNRG